ncbi:MAG: N4-gp56 family major capsid protein [Clostridiales bacterium]|nr:N4-gp56 family major capsid protein [Clostridiales bacterium]MDY4173256.1 N4-gp56 family major capsid protein [Evtepia sp.]
MDNLREIFLLPVDLNLFDGNTNVTTQTGDRQDLSGEMKTYYSDYLIDMAEPNLVHDQFGQKHPIPKNGGKTIEFRKYDPLPKALTPLTEGVTPDGQKLSMGVITATVQQYGGFIELSDVLLLTAIDNNLIQATKLLGSQAGRTLDTITREVLNGGTNVQYAEGQVSSRSALVGGSATEGANHYLTVDAVRKAVRFLKVMNAPKIDGYYVGIIHPDCAYDLMSDPKWVNVKTYSDPEGIYEGEIGRIEGVRFVETSEAKVFPGEGADGRDVYATLILGADAYGVTELAGGGLQHIVKQLGSAGTADPLNQRATAGWKATKVAERLVEPYMVRIETTSTFTA